MRKSREFEPDVAQLPIAEKAKSVVEGFLEAECTPTYVLSPWNARRLRETILEDIDCAAEDAIIIHSTFSSKVTQKATTIGLARSLRLLSCSKGYRAYRGREMAEKLRVLAELIKSICSIRGFPKTPRFMNP